MAKLPSNSTVCDKNGAQQVRLKSLKSSCSYGTASRHIGQNVDVTHDPGGKVLFYSSKYPFSKKGLLQTLLNVCLDSTNRWRCNDSPDNDALCR